jgi:hypothetical protein
VTKPWVLEEIDTATVRRIQGECRIVPVTLDADVNVPVALSHLLRLSMPREGLEGIATELERLCFGHNEKPTLGNPPSYVQHDVTRSLFSDPVDDLVFDAIVALLRQWPLNSIVYSNEAQEAVAAQGVSASSFQESMDTLVARGLVVATAMLGGQRWWIHGIPSRAWLDEERRAGIDVERMSRAVLAAAVNNESLDSFSELLNERTIGAILDELQSEGLISYAQAMAGDKVTFVVQSISPRARRRLRES